MPPADGQGAGLWVRAEAGLLFTGIIGMGRPARVSSALGAEICWGVDGDRPPAAHREAVGTGQGSPLPVDRNPRCGSCIVTRNRRT